MAVEQYLGFTAAESSNSFGSSRNTERSLFPKNKSVTLSFGLALSPAEDAKKVVIRRSFFCSTPATCSSGTASNSGSASASATAATAATATASAASAS